MKKYLKIGILFFSFALISLPVLGQNINVTMILNTATNIDTVMEHHTVQIRGEADGEVVPAITWDETSGIVMENIGGDYWKATFQIAPGTSLRYKFWTGFDATTGTMFWGGWEGPITPADAADSGDNRLLIAGSNDTTLAVQYYHAAETAQNQYWRPYESKPDSFAVYFRVNLGAYIETKDFDPEVDGPVAVRGGVPVDPTDTWETDIILERESGSADGGAFYSGAAYVANDAVSAGTEQQFKYVFTKGGSVVWESTPNRTFTFSGANDTTIYWAYFNDSKPTGGNIVEAQLTWQIKTDGLEKLGFFDRGLGDNLVIDGAKAWDVDNAIQPNYVPLLQLWMAQEDFTKAPGAVLEYKSVLLWHESRADAASANYIPGMDLEVPLQYWEEPTPTGSGNRNYTVTKDAEQMVPGDYGLDWQYFNGLPAEGVIETPISVTFNIDMVPAADINTNPSNPLFRPGVDTVWVQFYGCLMPLTQGDGIYENTPIELSDPDGDAVYSATLDLIPPTTYVAGYRINYSSETGATIQNGGGFTKGRSYYQFVHPTSIAGDGTIVWPAQFSFPTVEWKDSDLTVEDPPDLFNPMSIETDLIPGTITSYKLEQNYPNPFNPETTINYHMVSKSHVEIRVYNIVGQLVSTLMNQEQVPGVHSVKWNGQDSRGVAVPSGIYFVKMKTGSFSQIRKMTLLK